MDGVPLDIAGGPAEGSDLSPKKAPPRGEWNDDDFDVLADGKARIA
jgi:hypothetical protein